MAAEHVIFNVKSGRNRQYIARKCRNLRVDQVEKTFARWSGTSPLVNKRTDRIWNVKTLTVWQGARKKAPIYLHYMTNEQMQSGTVDRWWIIGGVVWFTKEGQQQCEDVYWTLVVWRLLKASAHHNTPSAHMQTGESENGGGERRRGQKYNIIGN